MPAEVDTGVCPKLLHQLLLEELEALNRSYDKTSKRRGVNKCARPFLARAIAYAKEQVLRDQLRYTQPPS